MSLFGRRESRNVDWWGAGFEGPPLSGRVVTPESAVYLAPVFAAIRHLVDYAATSDLDAYRDNGDGTRAEVALPQFLRMQDAPGKAGLGQFIGQAMYGVVAHGNAVGWKVDVDAYGNPTDVAWLKRTQYAYDLVAKRWLVGGAPVDASRIVHVPWIVPPGEVLGLSPIEHYRSIVSAGLSAQEYSDLRRGGGIPPAILKNTATTFSSEDADTMKRRAVASFADGKPLVTGSDWDFSMVSIPPNQALFIETMKMSANQIAAIYGLEPREVGGNPPAGSDTLKYVNDESLALNRAQNARPYLVRLSDALSRLMPLKQYVGFDLNTATAVDMKTRFEIYQIERALGTMSRNEIRAAEDRPPIPGGDDYTPAAPGPTPPPSTPNRAAKHTEGDTP